LTIKPLHQKNNSNTMPFIAQQQKYAAAAMQSSFDTTPKNPMKMVQKVKHQECLFQFS